MEEEGPWNEVPSFPGFSSQQWASRWDGVMSHPGKSTVTGLFGNDQSVNFVAVYKIWAKFSWGAWLLLSAVPSIWMAPPCLSEGCDGRHSTTATLISLRNAIGILPSPQNGSWIWGEREKEQGGQLWTNRPGHVHPLGSFHRSGPCGGQAVP